VADVAEQTPDAPQRREDVPTDVEAKLKRGRDGLNEVIARRQLGIKFANNNHFAELNDEGTKVVDLSTATVAQGGTKPDHRVRRSHDIVSPMLGRKISSAMQREPEWESTAVANDMTDYAAARIAMRLARAGYESWGFPTAEEKALWFAMVTEETFGRAAWNPNVGPYTDVSIHPEADVEDEEGNKPYAGQPDPEKPVYRGRGEIGVTVYSGLEVLWESGVDFDDSRWHAVEHARSIEAVEAEPEFIKVPGEKKLQPDAAASSDNRRTARDKKAANSCIVTEYFERPCPKYPKGRWLTFANDRKIFPDAPYPYTDAEGNVVDRPCLRRLIYDIDGSNDRAKGLVQKVIDEVRSYDQAINKQAEYSQIGLVAQILAGEGVLLTDPTDEPGLVVEYDRTLANGEKPEWRENIPFPDELFTMEERAKQRFVDISFDQDIPNQVESGTAINSVVELSRVAWQRFVDRFDRFRSGLMSDCLVLAQRNYGADRLMKFRGPTGWEPVGDFQGADIRSQTDVAVKQSAMQMLTRPQVEQRIMQLVQTFPNTFKPEVVIEALTSATPEKLIQGYEEDVGRAHRIIEQLRNGTFWSQPLRPALPGEEVLEEIGGDLSLPLGERGGRPMVPGWLPRPFDSLPVLKAAMENWMKSDDWDRSPRQTKDASLLYYQKLIDLETAATSREEEIQSEIAEEQGMANAGKEPAPKPSPSLPGGSPQVGGGNGETPVEASPEPEPAGS
jgi:hypothetical protein